MNSFQTHIIETKLFNMSVVKQLTIHNLSAKFGLPREMAHEILGFCFYDTVTAVHRAVHKKNMNKIIIHFDDAYISRAKPGMACWGSDLSNDPDNSEAWEIHLAIKTQEYDEEIQFQAANCRSCGNYKLCWTYIPTREQFLYDIDEVVDIRLWREAIPIQIRCVCQDE